MILDVIRLREFYVSPLGLCVRRLLRTRVARLWPDMRSETVAVLGYGTPLLRPWLGQVASVLAVMPDTQGAVYWPREGANVCCLADLGDLPLPDELVSRVVLLHALEACAAPEAVLSEVWRVIKPQGRALVFVANRRSLWAHGHKTPFSAGRAFTAAQMRGLLMGQGFTIERSGKALFMPPVGSRLFLMLAEAFEKVGPYVLFGCGGVSVIEVSKQIMTPILTKSCVSHPRRSVPMQFPASPLPTG